MSVPVKITPTLEPQTCPCCEQNVQLYHRKLSTGMVAELVELYRMHQETVNGTMNYPNTLKVLKGTTGIVWIHRDLFVGKKGSGDYAKMRFWGLIVPKDTRSPTENASGYWAITGKGIDFVEKKIQVPDSVFVYANKLHSVSANMIGLGETSNFNYQDLMM